MPRARRAPPAETDWARIAALYDALARVTPSPIVELNRAVAVAMAFGPAAGLAIVDALTSEPALKALSPAAERARRSAREARPQRRGARRIRARRVADAQRARACVSSGACRRLRATLTERLAPVVYSSELRRPMKYLCLIYLDEQHMAAMPAADMNALNVRHLDFNDDIRRTGHFIEAEALDASATSATVRVRNGKPSVTDGPFTESKELVAGFYLIEADDLREATEIAARIPAANIGTVEVWPTRQLIVEGR